MKLILESEKLGRLDYFKNLWLFFKTLMVVFDQINDIILVATQYYKKRYWLASIYLAVDVMPAAVIIKQKLRKTKERNWKILVKNVKKKI